MCNVIVHYLIGLVRLFNSHQVTAIGIIRFGIRMLQCFFRMLAAFENISRRPSHSTQLKTEKSRSLNAAPVRAADVSPVRKVEKMHQVSTVHDKLSGASLFYQREKGWYCSQL